MEEGRRTEHNQEKKRNYHHVYSMDCFPLLEHHIMFLVLSPEELLIQDENKAAAERMLEKLALAIAHLSPIQAQRLHARYVLKKKFREIAEEEGVSSGCVSASVTNAIKKLQKFFIKNGWMSKEA